MSTKDINCHIMLIGQLGSDKKVRGSLDWTFLPDIVIKLSKAKLDEKVLFDFRKKLSDNEKIKFDFHLANQRKENEKRFVFEIPEKNRYGKTGDWCIFQHEDNGIKFISSSF
jgi:hypothetical protein